MKTEPTHPQKQLIHNIAARTGANLLTDAIRGALSWFWDQFFDG